MKAVAVFFRRVLPLTCQRADTSTILPLHDRAVPRSADVWHTNTHDEGPSSNAEHSFDTPTHIQPPNLEEATIYRQGISSELFRSQTRQVALETAQVTVPHAAELVVDILRKIVGLFTHADRICRIFTILACVAFALGVRVSLVVVIVWAYESIRNGGT
ncbi:hypothetical protein OF83DRAFT_1175164 [Amylostereum chailletii]|nr:hypothetical protein OF83DRAFT_1175164 [Amylostereum chailletii]